MTMFTFGWAWLNSYIIRLDEPSGITKINSIVEIRRIIESLDLEELKPRSHSLQFDSNLRVCLMNTKINVILEIGRITELSVSKVLSRIRMNHSV